MKSTLPSGPPSLCFNKEEFMKKDFNVESFVVECRRRVSLETLGEDLGVYLKILQSAMIELINKDYADFVNLSTNLVGMNKAINNLMTPMNQLRTEVLGVREAMDEAVSAIEEKLQRKNDIREKKASLQRLINIIQCVEKMESLLGISKKITSADDVNPSAEVGKIGSENDSQAFSVHQRELSGQLIERVATEFNKLQFYVSKSRGLPLVEEIRPRVMNITTMLQYSLEGSFKEGLETSNINVLTECLRTYATIDKMRDAENLFRQHMIKPGLEEIISEHFMKNSPQGLVGMYNAVLDFIPTHCHILREVTSGAGGGEAIRGYDFMVNSVWPEVVTSIENRTPSIFAPGNPTIFHERYLSSMTFLDRFERLCGSQASVKHLRTHPSYNTFMTKWSLPVYFQIRFQEIAGDFEGALLDPLAKAGSADDHSTPGTDPSQVFHHQATEKLWDCLLMCWKPNIYLQPLSHRFWKLTLQLLSRYAVWLQELYQLEVSPEARAAANTNGAKAPNTPATGTVKAPNGVENGDPGNGNTGDGSNSHPPPITLTQVVCVVSDVHKLSSKMSTFFAENVASKMRDIGLGDTTILEESLEEAVVSINVKLPQFGDFIVREISNECLGFLKPVSDIPRLYRRTNREPPTKASSYVTAVFRPIVNFLEVHKVMIAGDNCQQWSCVMVQNISEVYLSTTSDVLTSVKKMEESLKRLKKSKSSAALSSQGVSDDDKIRLQLYLDVSEFGVQIAALQLDKDSIDSYKQLYDLVEAAKMGSGV